MNVHYLRKVRRLFNEEANYVDRELNRINQRKWVAAVRRLGHRWLLHPQRSTQ